MPSARSALRFQLTEQLLPRLRSMGFRGPSVLSGNALIHDFKRELDGVTQVLTVQLEKNGLPRFVLGLSVEPPEGFESLIRRGGVVLQARVQPRKGATTRAWFRSDAPLWRRVLGLATGSEVEAVSSCIALLPEIEAWWQTQEPSQHIVVLTRVFPGERHATHA